MPILPRPIGLLMRLIEIPARVVVGFQGGILNNYAEFLTVRGADAHSWIEYWDEAKGWVRFDPLFLLPGKN